MNQVDLALMMILDIEKYINGLNAKFKKKIDKLISDAKAEIVRIELVSSLPLTERKNKLKILLEVMQDISKQSFDQIYQEVIDELDKIGGVTARKTKKGIDKILDIDLKLSIKDDFFRGKAETQKVDKISISKHFKKQNKSFDAIIKKTLVESLDRSYTVDKQLNAVGRVGNITKRKATSLFATSALQIFRIAQNELYEQNAEMFREIVIISVLDERTTEICKSLNYARYDYKTHKPIGKTRRWAGLPPYHYWCRTVFIVIVKNSKEEIPKIESFRNWLYSQTEEVQKYIFGKDKFRLFMQGKLDNVDLVRNNKIINFKNLFSWI